MNDWLKMLSACSLAAAVLLPPSSVASQCEREHEPILGKDPQYSDNWLLSTVQATTVASIDASLHASSDATSDGLEGTTSEDDGREKLCPPTATRFIAANKTALARDIATGHGEHLSALSVLLAVKDAERTRFFELAQVNFQKIYPTVDVSSGEIAQSLQRIILTDLRRND